MEDKYEASTVGHILPATEEFISDPQSMRRIPNSRLKNPKTIAEKAKYCYIPQRSTRNGAPVFKYTNPRRQSFYCRGNRFYEISLGGYLYEITGFIRWPSAAKLLKAKLLKDEHATRDTDNEPTTDSTNDHQKGNQRGNWPRRGSYGGGPPDATGPEEQSGSYER